MSQYKCDFQIFVQFVTLPSKKGEKSDLFQGKSTDPDFRKMNVFRVLH